MALTVVSSGTVGALVVGTETNLEALRTPGSPTVYAYEVDTENMVSPEVVFLRVYTTTLSGGNEKELLCRSWIAGTDFTPIMVTVPVPANISIRCTLQQKNGTGRSFPWVLYSPE